MNLSQEKAPMSDKVIVIGAGLAGMIAAYTAQAEGAKVLLIDRSGIGVGTNSAMSNGRFSGPTTSYSADQYIRDTLHTGKMINHGPLVKRFAHEALDALAFFCSTGFEFEEFYDHYFLKSSSPDVIRGVTMVKRLADNLRSLKRISVLSGFYVTDILKQGAQVLGVKGIDKSGKEVSIASSSVILATGGGGAIYLRNDNQKSMMGHGYYLAAKAGLSLWDMEFIQFYPIVIAQPRLPSIMLYPPYPGETRLINTSGEDILRKYGIDDVNEAMRKKRDSLSAMLFEEGHAGPVYMDFRKVPSSSWETFPLSLLRKIKFDFENKPVEISPGAHFFMGGIRTDESGQTDLSGLYVCGEVAWGFHGANRLSGNALTECLVSGRIAGRSAARNIHSRRLSDADIQDLPENRGSTSGAQLLFKSTRLIIREIAWEHAGIVRTDSGLNEGLTKLKVLEKELKAGAPKNVTEMKKKEDMLSAVFVVKAILTASLARKESRGAFIRKEFPIKENDENIKWRKNSCLTFDPEKDEFSISHHPVIGLAP